MLVKICSYAGCQELVQYGVKYCDKHNAKAKLDKQDSFRAYRRRMLQDEVYVKHKRFYNSVEWIRVKEVAINQTLGIDIVLFYKTGEIKQGDIVHHITPISEDYEGRLDLDNLIYLTQETHNKIHGMYNRSDADYKRTVMMLFELKNKFREDFGLI